MITMKEKILELVDRICSMESLNCRSLNKSELARKLMDIAEIPMDAIIHEIPLDWDRQVEIMFTVPEDTLHKVNYYFGLFAGIGTDGNFHLDLFKCGEWNKKYGYFDFYVRDKLIPIDYFKTIKA
jgi:hypothetical protein